MTDSSRAPGYFVSPSPLFSTGCGNTEAKQAQGGGAPALRSKCRLSACPPAENRRVRGHGESRRSASIQPQVDGSLTTILVKSGDHVRVGQC